MSDKEQTEKCKESGDILIHENNLKTSDKVPSYKVPLETSVFNRELGRCSTRSDDSLDSGVSLRPKSTDSMDSLDSSESGYNGEGTIFLGLSPLDEALPPLPHAQYEDYLRECQDIQQSITGRTDEEKQPVSRTNSGDDQDESEDAETEWFRMAGLSDLVMSPSNTMMTSSESPAVAPAGPENFSSMTVLSTLTRPQREAVLRRISSFNRAQKSKRRSKPSLASVFPGVDLSPKSTHDVNRNVNNQASESKLEKSEASDVEVETLNVPQEAERTETLLPRRFSEVARTRTTTLPITMADIDITDGSHHSRMEYSFTKHKKNVDSIVATNLSGGIETLSISSKSSYADGSSWKGSKEELVGSNGSGKIGKNMSYTENAKEENLPNYSLVRDRLGITKISDLHNVDMRKVQSLAIIELTALFDLRSIDFKRRKLGKSKLKETGVFGIPLSVLVEWDQKRLNDPDLRVPLVLSEIISFLENNALRNEGILRKSGSAARIKMLKQDLENRYGVHSNTISPLSESETWKEAHPNDVAALLKQFLRELPDPLLTTQFIDAFQSCGLIMDRKEQLQALNLLVILLNEVHRDSLKLLLKFLGQVVANEPHNKMSLNNVAMITAPNLFISGRKSKKETNTGQDLKHAAGTSNIVRMLIKYHKLLWTVPAFMLSQVRLMHSAQITTKKHHSTSKDKYKNFFRGKSKDPNKKSQANAQPFDSDMPKNVMRVQAPNMQLTSIAVQLEPKLTAGDIIAKYRRQCERMNHSTTEVGVEINNTNHALYEVGGNITERCLDPDTNMAAVIKVNPDATWLIKTRRDS